MPSPLSIKSYQHLTHLQHLGREIWQSPGQDLWGGHIFWSVIPLSENSLYVKAPNHHMLHTFTTGTLSSALQMDCITWSFKTDSDILIFLQISNLRHGEVKKVIQSHTTMYLQGKASIPTQGVCMSVKLDS